MDFQSPQKARDKLYYELDKRGKIKSPIHFYILEEIFRYPKFFTIQDLTDHMQSLHYSVSRHTIAKTIKLMDSIGLIQKRHSRPRKTKIYAWKGKFRKG